MAFGQYLGYVVGAVGAVVGGVIGFYSGGPAGAVTGAMWGFSIGSMVGGISGQIFWPERADLNFGPPPQPHETRLQFSSWGMAIPIQYGSGRMAGNIIYMSDITETIERSRHRQDGVRYYEMVRTYTATFAIAFCGAPATGWVNRIWVNNKIFVDYTAGNPGNLDTSITRSVGFFSIRMGYETQTYDTDIAAIIGAAETPAYRGICYITFVDFPIGEFSGVPNIEIEILDSDPVGWWCSDNFDGLDGALPNPSCWVITSQSAYIDGNKLKLISAPYSAIAEIRSVSTRTGDFDAQVDYSDASMLSGGSFTLAVLNTSDHSPYGGAQVRYYLEAWPTLSKYVWVSLQGGYSYGDFTPGPAAYGKMRITRVGTTVTLYMKNTTDAAWTTVKIFTGASTDAMWVRMWVWNRYPTSKANYESIKFDNFLSL
jgi:hypothetical protein